MTNQHTIFRFRAVFPKKQEGFLKFLKKGETLGRVGLSFFLVFKKGQLFLILVRFIIGFIL
jgi:hypothetical protein